MNATTETTLPYAADMDTTGLGRFHADPRDRDWFTAQKPYRNGVTVYCHSRWNGNGLGTSVERVAVRNDEVVAVYQSCSGGAYGSRTAKVAGVGDIDADIGWHGYGEYRRTYVKRTALAKWIEAVKAL